MAGWCQIHVKTNKSANVIERCGQPHDEGSQGGSNVCAGERDVTEWVPKGKSQ